MVGQRGETRGTDSNDSRLRRGLRSSRLPILLLGGLLVFLLGTYAIVFNASRPRTPGRELTLDVVKQEVGSRTITEVTLLAVDHRLVGVDDEGDWWAEMGPNDILTANLLNSFAESGVQTKIDPQRAKAFLKLASDLILPVATLIAGFAFLYFLFLRSGSRDFTGMGRSKARRYAEEESNRVTFSDVAGLEEAIEELREVGEFLASPETFEAMGARPPRGVLLSGPPGCGKTLLARAVAGEANVPFFSIAASEFVEMLVGVGPARVRDLFEKARASAPSIVFIDELDAVGRSRSAVDGLNAEGESTLNELLVQLDGFDSAKRVLLMAATNRPDILDQALIRKGRFDRQIVIDAPDVAGRLAIARIHARGKPFSRDVDLEAFARRTPGFTGADIAAALNDAATLAARRRLSSIGSAELSEAIERVQAGPERRSRVLTPEDKRHVAYHEAGHALVGWVLHSALTVEKVSIVARGHSLGSTWNLPTDDRRVRTRSQFEEDLAYMLGGRAAEDVVFGDPADGAVVDLSRASQLARAMVYEFGMSKSLGPLALGPPGFQVREHSPELLQEADREVRALLDDADQRARAVLLAYRTQLDELADLLVSRETLERQELESVLGRLTKGAPAPPPPPPRPKKPSGSRRAAPAPAPVAPTIS